MWAAVRWNQFELGLFGIKIKFLDKAPVEVLGVMIRKMV